MDETKNRIITIEQALADYKAGSPIIIIDDEDRENEGDLVVAAEFATPEIINLMAKEARGLLCVPMTRERLRELPDGRRRRRAGAARHRLHGVGGLSSRYNDRHLGLR
jgi:hypothetical protein